MEKSNNNIVCPNCQNEFDKGFDFCPHCGQKNKSIDLHFTHLLSDFLSSAFNIDSKFAQTFRLLIFYPGSLTKEFLAGKRTKYLPPIQIYLIVSLVYFTLLSFLPTDIIKINDDGNNTAVGDSLLIGDSLNLAQIPLAEEIDTVLQQIPDQDKLAKEDLVITMDNIDQLGKVFSDTVAEEDKSETDKAISRKLQLLGTEEGKAAFTNLFRKYMSVGMFILMPLTAFIFFLMFFKGTYYVQHLVFVLHLQSVMYILFIVLNLIGLLVSNTYLELLGAATFLFLLLIWIRKFYEVSWWRTTWKSILFLFYFAFLFLFFMGSVALVAGFNL